MAAQIDPHGNPEVTVTTDANGIVTFNKMFGYSVDCYFASGPSTIRVFTEGGSLDPLTVNETVSS